MGRRQRLYPRLDDERRNLAEDPMGMHVARRLARSFARRLSNNLADDVLSVAFLALAHAAAKYEPERGVPFTAFCSMCIARELKDYCRKDANRQLTTNAKAKDHPERDVVDVIESHEPPVGWALDYEDEVRVIATRTADAMQSDIVLHYYLDASDCRMKGIARRLGLSRTMASDYHLRATREYGVELRRRESA